MQRCDGSPRLHRTVKPDDSESASQIENRDTHWKRHSGSRLITKLDIGIRLIEIFSPDEVNPLVEWVYMRRAA